MAFTFLTPMGQFSASMSRDLSAAFREGDRCLITQHVSPHSLCFQNLHFPAFFPLRGSLLSDLGCYVVLSPITYCGGIQDPVLAPSLPTLTSLVLPHYLTASNTICAMIPMFMSPQELSLVPKLPEPTSHGSITDLGDTPPTNLTCAHLTATLTCCTPFPHLARSSLGPLCFSLFSHTPHLLQHVQQVSTAQSWLLQLPLLRKLLLC